MMPKYLKKMIIVSIALVVINICLILINIVMIGTVFKEYPNNISPEKNAIITTVPKSIIDGEEPLFEASSLGQRETPDVNNTRTLPMLSLTLDLPKIDNEGEDAPPLLTSQEKGSVIGVFDGMGGAGAEVYQETEQKHTGAYFASRTVKDIVEQFLQDSTAHDNGTEALSNSMKEIIKAGLQKKRETLKGSKSLLTSKMIKTLPTTMAVSIISNKEDKWNIQVFWAGDSRVYLLNPNTGLSQLTKDDLRIEQDPFQNLYSDSRLNNMINLSQDFTINCKEYETELPCLVLAATDGCFGYLPSPMHFEGLLLETMFASNSIDEWKLKLIEKLKEIACDDCTMSLISNLAEYDTLKNSFNNRYQFLSQEMSVIDDEIRKAANNEKNGNATKEILEKHWNTYKITNYSFF